MNVYCTCILRAQPLAKQLHTPIDGRYYCMGKKEKERSSFSQTQVMCHHQILGYPAKATGRTPGMVVCVPTCPSQRKKKDKNEIKPAPPALSFCKTVVVRQSFSPRVCNAFFSPFHSTHGARCPAEARSSFHDTAGRWMRVVWVKIPICLVGGQGKEWRGHIRKRLAKKPDTNVCGRYQHEFLGSRSRAVYSHHRQRRLDIVLMVCQTITVYAATIPLIHPFGWGEDTVERR